MPTQDYQYPTISDPTYQIQSVLGSGGGGVVYKAWHTRLQKPVVLKQIKGEGKFESTPLSCSLIAPKPSAIEQNSSPASMSGADVKSY